MKWFVRIAICAVLALGLWCCGSRDTGRWKCTACGAHERRNEVGPFSWKKHLPSEYQDWFNKNVAVAHDHDWVAVGCHERGSFIMGIIACTIRELVFQDEIQSLQDRPSALIAAKRLAELSRDERYRELEEAEVVNWHMMPMWQSPSGGAKPTSGELEALRGYAAWWKSHVRWQDVFPKPKDVP